MNIPKQFRPDFTCGSGLQLILFLIVATSLGGCQPSPYSRLEGVWQEEGPKGNVVWTFRRDKSYAILDPGALRGPDFFGDYSFDGSTVRLAQFKDEDRTLEIEIVALGTDQLLIRDGLGTTITWRRVTKESPPASTLETYSRSAKGREERKQKLAETWSMLYDKSATLNARQLALAAEQYFFERGVSEVDTASLRLEIYPVAGETYPARIVKGQPIVVTGIQGSRTLTVRTDDINISGTKR